MDGSFENDLPHFQAIINKYECLFEELSQELFSVKSEHDIVKSKLSTLVKENQELRRELNKSQTCDKPVENDEIIDCLKQQIESLLSEKDDLKKLWINANETIELLEGELQVYQSGELVPKSDFINVRKNYEKRLNELEQKLQFAQKTLEKSSKAPTENNAENPLKICHSISLENQEGALKIVKNLEEEVLILQKRLQDSEKTVAKLQKILKEKDESITIVSKKNLEYRDKVSEAIEVVHAALNEKDAALFREKEAKDEIEKVSQQLADIMKETEEKIRNEVAKIKNEYIVKEENFQMDLKNLRNDVSIKSLEIEKYCTKNALLENELDRFRKGNISMDDMNSSKLLILEKNLESTFQKLLLSEKNNIQLASEKETIKNDMVQMAEHYERIVKTKEVEKISFENRIKQVQNDLEETKTSLKNIKEQLELEKEQKKLIEKEYLEKIEEQERTLTKKFAVTLSETTATFNEKMAQLQRHLEMKDELNRKWSIETKDIVKKLETFIGQLKKELRMLRKENSKLRSQLEYEKKRFEQYKYFLKIIASDVDHSDGVVQENVGTPV